MPWKDPKHPLWPLLRLVAMMATLVAILYMTATTFDETELKTIITMFLAATGIEGGIHLASGRSK